MRSDARVVVPATIVLMLVTILLSLFATLSGVATCDARAAISVTAVIVLVATFLPLIISLSGVATLRRDFASSSHMSKFA